MTEFRRIEKAKRDAVKRIARDHEPLAIVAGSQSVEVKTLRKALIVAAAYPGRFMIIETVYPA